MQENRKRHSGDCNKRDKKNNIDGLISRINSPFPVVSQGNIIFKNIKRRSK